MATKETIWAECMDDALQYISWILSDRRKQTELQVKIFLYFFWWKALKFKVLIMYIVADICKEINILAEHCFFFRLWLKVIFTATGIPVEL